MENKNFVIYNEDELIQFVVNETGFSFEDKDKRYIRRYIKRWWGWPKDFPCLVLYKYDKESGDYCDCRTHHNLKYMSEKDIVDKVNFLLDALDQIKGPENEEEQKEE